MGKLNLDSLVCMDGQGGKILKLFTELAFDSYLLRSASLMFRLAENKSSPSLNVPDAIPREESAFSLICVSKVGGLASI